MPLSHTFKSQLQDIFGYTPKEVLQLSLPERSRVVYRITGVTIRATKTIFLALVDDDYSKLYLLKEYEYLKSVLDKVSYLMVRLHWNDGVLPLNWEALKRRYLEAVDAVFRDNRQLKKGELSYSEMTKLCKPRTIEEMKKQVMKWLKLELGLKEEMTKEIQAEMLEDHWPPVYWK